MTLFRRLFHRCKWKLIDIEPYYIYEKQKGELMGEKVGECKKISLLCEICNEEHIIICDEKTYENRNNSEHNRV
jgi:hypothetical protein